MQHATPHSLPARRALAAALVIAAVAAAAPARGEVAAAPAPTVAASAGRHLGAYAEVDAGLMIALRQSASLAGGVVWGPFRAGLSYATFRSNSSFGGVPDGFEMRVNHLIGLNAAYFVGQSSDEGFYVQGMFHIKQQGVTNTGTGDHVDLSSLAAGLELGYVWKVYQGLYVAPRIGALYYLKHPQGSDDAPVQVGDRSYDNERHHAWDTYFIPTVSVGYSLVTGWSARAIVGSAAGCREMEPAMARTTDDKRAAFRQLHEGGCFVIPNPWDVGSARLLQHLGFAALATTSAGFAWSRGRPDNAVTLDDVLAHLRELCAAVELPVNADFESGFARDAAGVADHVTRALATGVAGLSIEDRELDSPYPLFALDHAVERVKAARAAIDADGSGAVLVARTERLLREPAAVTTAIDALVTFADAGADCLFAPGVRDPEAIAAMVRAVAPRPLNVLMMRPGLSVRELEDLGVRRISVGGALARVAWGAMIAAARQMHDGSFDGLASAAPAADLNGIFGGFAD